MSITITGDALRASLILTARLTIQKSYTVRLAHTQNSNKDTVRSS